MKTARRWLVLLLVLALVLALSACGSKKEEAPAPEQSASGGDAGGADASGAEEYPAGYTIGHTNLGSGPWILDLYETNVRYICDNINMDIEFVPASANFSSDQMVKDIQNQINAGEDAHLYFAAFGTLTPTVSDMFQKAEVYWSVFNQMVTKDALDLVNANPFYCGSIGEDSAKIASALGELAAEMGYKKAGMMAGAVGDVIHDTRMDSFQQAFEAGGGEVVAVARCTDPSEAAAKADDLLAAYGTDFDCFYAINMDFVLAVIHSMENYGLEDIMCFASDCDAEGLAYVRSGEMIAHSNMGMDSVFAMPLIINALDGHKIVDAEGNAPYYDILLPWDITPDKADDYQEYWLDNFPVTPEAFETLLYRNNPEVDYEYLADFLQGYNYEYVMSTHS